MIKITNHRISIEEFTFLCAQFNTVDQGFTIYLFTIILDNFLLCQRLIINMIFYILVVCRFQYINRMCVYAQQPFIFSSDLFCIFESFHIYDSIFKEMVIAIKRPVIENAHRRNGNDYNEQQGKHKYIFI